MERGCRCRLQSMTLARANLSRQIFAGARERRLPKPSRKESLTAARGVAAAEEEA